MKVKPESLTVSTDNAQQHRDFIPNIATKLQLPTEKQYICMFIVKATTNRAATKQSSLHAWQQMPTKWNQQESLIPVVPTVLILPTIQWTAPLCSVTTLYLFFIARFSDSGCIKINRLSGLMGWGGEAIQSGCHAPW